VPDTRRVVSSPVYAVGNLTAFLRWVCAVRGHRFPPAPDYVLDWPVEDRCTRCWQTA
jgi:hypothetical protein